LYFSQKKKKKQERKMTNLSAFWAKYSRLISFFGILSEIASAVSRTWTGKPNQIFIFVNVRIKREKIRKRRRRKKETYHILNLKDKFDKYSLI